MPIIPYQADLGSQQDTFSSKPNQDAYTQNAKSFERLGQNIMVTGEAISKAQIAYDKEKKDITKESARLAGEGQAVTDLNKAIQDSDGDPQKILPLYQQYTEKSKKDFLGQFKGADKFDLAELDNTYSSGSIRHMSTAFVYTSQMQKKDLGQSMLGTLSQNNASTRLNPADAEKNYNSGLALLSNSAMTPLNKQNATNEFRKSTANAAIDGYLTGASTEEDYQNARDVVNRRFADAYDPRNDEARKALNYIEDARIKNNQNGLIGTSVEKEQAQQRQQIARDTNARELFKAARDSSDPTNPGPIPATEVLKRIDEAIASNTVKPTYGQLAKRMVTGADQGTDNHEKVSEFYSRLVSRDRLLDLQDQVAGAGADGIITAKTADTLITEIGQARQKYGDGKVANPKDQTIEDQTQAIKHLFANPNTGFPIPEFIIPQRNALEEFHKNLNDPHFNGDVRMAADTAIARNYKIAPISGLHVFKGETAKDMKDELARLKKTGKIPAETFVQLWRAADQKARDEKNVRSRKDGVKSGN